jgi:hypothetical protein
LTFGICHPEGHAFDPEGLRLDRHCTMNNAVSDTIQLKGTEKSSSSVSRKGTRPNSQDSERRVSQPEAA